MNTFRSAQCNAPEGFYAEAYGFNNSFPFCRVRADSFAKANENKIFSYRFISQGF